MFTEDQLNFIRQLIDDRIAHYARLNHQANRPHSFHTINDIRTLILTNLEEFSGFCSGDEFHISTLTSFLKRNTELTADDKEPMQRGKANNPMTRFEQQVQSCFSKWHNPPIEKAARRGYYRFVNPRQAQP
jgi:hypothetical protein